MIFIKPKVHAEQSVDSLLRDAARRFIAERRDFIDFNLGPLFQRLASDAFSAEIRRVQRPARRGNPSPNGGATSASQPRGD